MGRTQPQDVIAEFTVELLRTGTMLADLASDLIEAIPEDAYPGEEIARVVIEMVAGTIRTTLTAHEPADVESATSLVAAARERVREHLELAVELSTRLHGSGVKGPRRTYG